MTDMKFSEAVQLLIDSRTPVRAKSWGLHPTKRFLRIQTFQEIDKNTLQDNDKTTEMIQVVFYNFLKEVWHQSWSVFMPMLGECQEPWEVVPVNEIPSQASIVQNERFIELFICHQGSLESFEGKYKRLMMKINNVPGLPNDYSHLIERA